jgi:hypothetical protein
MGPQFLALIGESPTPDRGRYTDPPCTQAKGAKDSDKSRPNPPAKLAMCQYSPLFLDGNFLIKNKFITKMIFFMKTIYEKIVWKFSV